MDGPAPKQLRDGRYTLLRRLGEGSQAETWEGRDEGAPAARPSAEHLARDFQRYVERARAGVTPNPHGLVAIKCFRLSRAKAWKDVELAEREAVVLRSLDHPNLPKYLEHFEEDGALYLVMEKIEGESLASLRARGERMSVAAVRRMLEDIGDALRYLHGRAPPIVHRDIKPANVIRRPDGSFALVDFGAVRDRLKPTGGSTVVGTFGYMAPEQFQGRAAPRSDLYGLAATALAMLTGQEPEDLPHEGLAIDVRGALAGAAPRDLEAVLASMLVPDPDRRAATIDDALARSAPKGRAPERPRRTRTEARRERRAERRERRAARRAAGVPFLPRLFAHLGLLVASIAVGIAVGVVAPLVLTLLSILFGPALRRAARACVSASARSQAAIGRASARVAGHDPASPPAHVRVAEPEEPDGARVRVGETLEDEDEHEHEDGAHEVLRSRR